MVRKSIVSIDSLEDILRVLGEQLCETAEDLKRSEDELKLMTELASHRSYGIEEEEEEGTLRQIDAERVAEDLRDCIDEQIAAGEMLASIQRSLDHSRECLEASQQVLNFVQQRLNPQNISSNKFCRFERKNSS